MCVLHTCCIQSASPYIVVCVIRVTDKVLRVITVGKTNQTTGIVSSFAGGKSLGQT